MTKQEIEDGYIYAGYPGLAGYAYQATTWCAECGLKIAERLLNQWECDGKLPEIGHDDLCDTDRFPVPTTECDWCDECGAFEG